MPDNERVLGVDHVQITIPSGRAAEARTFYVDLLGLHEIPKPESLTGRGGFWLDAGNLPVHVGIEPEWERSQTKAHIAWRVDDIGHWRERLAAAGCQIEDSVAIPGYDRFETRDPFGNRIEFIASRPAGSA